MPRRTILLAAATHGALALLAIIVGHSILLSRTGIRLGDPGLWVLALGLAMAATWVIAGRMAATDGPRIWTWWRKPDGHELFLLVFFLVLLVLFASGFERATGDGRNYFAQVRSIVVDHDLDFSNESESFRASPITSSFPVGAAVLWSPFYFAVHEWFGVLNLLGADLPRDGYWNPYQQAVGLASLLYGCAGLFLAYRLARRLSGRGAAAAATVSVCGGGFLIWYLTIEASYAHAVSFFTVTAFVTLWYTSRDERSRRRWVALGAMAALMTMVRWQNVLWILPVVLDEAVAAPRLLRLRDAELRQRARDWAACAGAFVVGVVPQLLVWKANYGGFFSLPEVMADSVWWHDPKPVEVLFSPNHGLLAWNPVLYLGLLGLPVLLRRDLRAGLPLIVCFTAQLFVVSAVEDWWGSSAFGGRRFDSTMLVFILGLALVLQFLQRRPAVAIAVILLPLVALNLTFIADIRAGKLLDGRGVTFDAMLGSLYERVGNPFSFPANLAFVITTGGSAAQYDRVGVQDFNNARIDIGAPGDERFLLGGWWPAEDSDADSFRWAGPDASGMVVPLVTPRHLSAGAERVQADYTLRLDVAAFPNPEGTAQVIEVEANGETVGRIEVSTARGTYEVEIPGRYMRRHLNHLIFRYRWHGSPARLGPGDDARELAVRFHRIDLLRH